MGQNQQASIGFRRAIGGSPVVVRCGADLERQAEELLDAVAKYHQGGAALHDGATVEHGGMLFTLRWVGGDIVVHESDFKGDTAPGADQSLRILYEQEAVVKHVGAEWSSAPLHARVKMERSSLRSLRLCLRRAIPSDPADSGWTIGEVVRDPAEPEADFMTTVVSEILRVRPWLGKTLALPPGYRVVMDFRNVESVETEPGKQVWIADRTTLTRLARSALKEKRLSDLERTVNALLESTTTESDTLRPVRQLARRWGSGPWVAYANAITALSRLKQDPDEAAVRSLVDELCSALSPGGRLAAEEAPFAITENFTALYRKYPLADAAELIDRLRTPGSSQQAALLFLRAVLAYDASDRVGVAEALRRSIEVEPRSATTWFLLGDVLLGELLSEETPTLVSRPDEVVEAFDRALALLATRDTFTVDRCVRALHHWNLGGNWQLEDLLRNRTVALRELGRLEEARASADRLVAAAPDQPRSWETLGTVLIALGRHEDAINAYSEAIGRSAAAPPDHLLLAHGFASPWYNRAAEHALLGHRAESLSDLRQALAFAPMWADAVLSDKRFQRLTGDDEIQRMVGEGRTAARTLEQQKRDDSST